MSESSKNVLTIGSFDGVHLGHAAIIRQVVMVAKEQNAQSLLITFEPHPRAVLFPENPPAILTPLPEKIRLLKSLGIDEVAVAPFTKAFAEMSAEAYIRHFLVAQYHPHTIVIGYDHRFGAGRTGNMEMLKTVAPDYGFSLQEIAAETIEEAAVSSTKIRQALLNGEVKYAAQMLGRPYRIFGTVHTGKQLGRTIGFPTANVVPDYAAQLMPAEGVYACRVHQNGNFLANGMTNIGRRPTVENDGAVKLEVHLLDGEGHELYGGVLDVDFIARLRGEQIFASLDALKAQLAQDKIQSEQALKDSL